MRWAFSVPGESFLPLLDALPRAGIRVVATRHEGGAAFMAEAIGQLTGSPAAVLGTRAVGAANMSIGIHTARQNSTPMFALLGQVRRDHAGREAFQEVDLAASFGRLAKWATQIDDPELAPRVIAEGFRLALGGRPGPALLALPEDVLDEPVEVDADPVRPPQPPMPREEEIDGALALLADARRPVILAGGGVLVAHATDDLVTFSERSGIPVMAAWRRPTVFPNEHPHYLGMTGFGAPATVAARLAEADAMLVIGCRLSEIATFDYRVPADTTRWAHVDLEPRTAGHGLSGPNIAVVADAAEFLRTALGRPLRRADVGVEADRAAYLAASTSAVGQWHGQGVSPGYVVQALQALLPNDSILTTDAGNFGLWLARGFRFGRRHGFLGPTSGAMGYGLPAAIAASLAEPQRAVVALCGDGGFAMTMNELETAVRMGTRPIVLVFDNRRYGTISMYQHRGGHESVATELGPIDFAALARACGARGISVGANAGLEAALREALSADRPTVIHLQLDPAWVTPDQEPIGRSMANAP